MTGAAPLLELVLQLSTQLARLVQWLASLPLDDVRFVALVGLAFSVAAFLGNLLVQHEEEEKEDPGDVVRGNAERHRWALAVLHLLREEGAGGRLPSVDQDLVARCVELLLGDPGEEEEEEESPEQLEAQGQGQQEQEDIVVDVFLLLAAQHARGLRSSLKSAPMDPRQELSRSRALLVVRLLSDGPESAGSRIAAGPGWTLVADYLTRSAVVLVTSALGEAGDAAALLGALAQSEVELAPLALGAGEPPRSALALVARCAATLVPWAASGEAGAGADEANAGEADPLEAVPLKALSSKLEGFDWVFVGHGLAGSVAAAAALLCQSHARRCKVACRALVFGAVPWLVAPDGGAAESGSGGAAEPGSGGAAEPGSGGAAEPSSGAADDSICFVCRDDLFPRLTPRALAGLRDLRAELAREPPAERLAALLGTGGRGAARTVRELVARGWPGLLGAQPDARAAPGEDEASSEDEALGEDEQEAAVPEGWSRWVPPARARLVQLGSVVLLDEERRWVELAPAEAAEQLFLFKSSSLLADHELAAYANALKSCE
jgi:hypothetical protein